MWWVILALPFKISGDEKEQKLSVQLSLSPQVKMATF